MQKETTFSVTQINEYIKMTLESNPVLSDVYLSGEISNFKSNYSSGHAYFSLKDASSSIRAVMFRSSASRLRFRPESGMKVVVHGRISTYTVSGDYQIIVDSMEPEGAGSLAVAFEQLKAKLAAEGLFDAARKKPIPPFPESVGVITSASGAALHDIINVSGRRSPNVRIVIYPAYVQGELAPRSLAGGIKFFNDRHPVDVIIIGRGGGSAEDLWCFNDENLARVISESEIPVISAVGHETDFTICDFVSDKRAPTPSAAAELAFPDTREIRARLSHLRHKADGAVSRRTITLEALLDAKRKSLLLHSPIRRLSDREARLTLLSERLDTLARSAFDGKNNSFRMLCARLEGVNPLAVLSHGYAMVESEDGRIISGVTEVGVGENIKIGFKDGSLRATVTSISEGDPTGENNNG